MFSGFYTTVPGMLMSQGPLDMAVSNTANMKTSGYKSRCLIKTASDQQLMRQMNGQAQGLGRGPTISVGTGEITVRGQGTVTDTGQTYNLVTNGDGFFMIQGADGQYLTRNSHFDRDGEGNLVLPGVGQVMEDDGPVRVDEDGFRVSSNGVIYDSEGGVLGQIQIAVPDSYDNLTFYNSGTYGTGNTVALEQVYLTVYQGKLEASGVNLNNEMIRAVEVQGAFQPCGKVLTIVNQMNQKVAGDIGKLQGDHT